MKNYRTKNTKHKTQKGITLIALVITIIIMLILVGVSITVALKGGLFSAAKQSKSDTQEAIEAEQTLADGRVKVDGVWYKSIDDYLNDKPYVELPEGIKVGDYINYTPDEGTYTVAKGEYGSGYTEEQSFTTETGESALKWRILSIDEETGKIELVSETVGQTLNLTGADGYNHGVDILNDLCRTLYSKTIDGKKIATARSINVEDINAKTTYDYTTYESYRDELQFSNYSADSRKYPKIYSKEDGYYERRVKREGGISGSEGLSDGIVNNQGVTEYTTVIGYSDDYSENSKDISVTVTYYNYAPENYLKDDLGINNAPVELIKLGETYWLASRSVGPYYNSCIVFLLRCISGDGTMYGNLLYYSLGTLTSSSFCAVRPVVTLEAGISLTKNTVDSINDVTYWNLEI